MEVSRNIKIDSISRLGYAPPVIVESTATVRQAVDALRSHQVGCVLIVAEKKLVGLFTERDLLARVLNFGLPLSMPVREAMTCQVITVKPKDTVKQAIQKMEEGGYRHLPVTDEHNCPVGVLSAKRILGYLVEHFATTVFIQPPEGQSYPDSPEGA
jgi:CBS domain-containing protein